MLGQDYHQKTFTICDPKQLCYLVKMDVAAQATFNQDACPGDFELLVQAIFKFAKLLPGIDLNYGEAISDDQRLAAAFKKLNVLNKSYTSKYVTPLRLSDSFVDEKCVACQVWQAFTSANGISDREFTFTKQGVANIFRLIMWEHQGKAKAARAVYENKPRPLWALEAETSWLTKQIKAFVDVIAAFIRIVPDKLKDQALTELVDILSCSTSGVLPAKHKPYAPKGYRTTIWFGAQDRWVKSYSYSVTYLPPHTTKAYVEFDLNAAMTSATNLTLGWTYEEEYHESA